MIRTAAVVLAGVIGIVAVGAQQGVPVPPPVAPAGQQNPAAPRPPATGIIAGKVVDASSGSPVAEVTLTLNGAALAAPPPGAGGGVQTAPIGPASQGTRRVITDGSGRFLFRDLPAGTFSLAALAGGYVSTSAGVMRPGGAGQQVILPQDGRLPDVVIRLFKFGVISGTLTEEAGDPVVGVSVRAFKADYVGGRRRLTGPSIVVTTDDRGAYRMAQLVPGDYAVAFVASSISMPAEALVASERANAAGSAASSAFSNDLSASGGNLFTQPSLAVGDWRLLTGTNARGPAPSENGDVFLYPTTFHAGSGSAQNATIVAVASGEEKTGIDFQIRPARTSRVSGVVTGPDGPMKLFGLRLLGADVGDQFASDSTFDPIISTTNSAGQFTFFGIAPGNYVLKAIKVPEPNGPMVPFVVNGPSGPMNATRPDPSAPSVLPSLWASVPVQVAGVDVPNLVVTLKEGVRVSGRVEFDGVAAPPAPDRLKQIGVVIEPPGSGFGGSQFSYFQVWRGALNDAGTFKSVQLPPGRYFIRGQGQPAGWTLESIIANGRDVTDVAFDVASSDIADVVIRFTDKSSQLNGVVKNAQRQNDPSASVLVFPSDASMWTDYGVAPRRLRIARASTTGAYSFASLPAGDYCVVAISDADAGAWQDPKYLAKAAGLAVRVGIERGQSKTLELSTVTVK